MRRRDFMQLVATLTSGEAALAQTTAAQGQERDSLSRETLIQAERIAGVSFTDAQRDMILPALQNYVQNMQSVREMSVPTEVAPALVFISDLNGVWTPKRPKRGEA